MPCIHKTYPTEDKALSAWYRLGEKRRDKLTIYQCKKCLGWRIVFWDTARKLANDEYSQQNVHQANHLVVRLFTAINPKQLTEFKNHVRNRT